MATFTSAPVIAAAPTSSIRYAAQQAATYVVAPTFAAAPATASTIIAAGCPMAKVGRGAAAPWGGGCPWQYDKTAFKEFCTTAVNDPASQARKDFYGFVAECFLDANSGMDGLVGKDEFDFLIESAATLPRRFGMAPSWPEMYGNLAARQTARADMFNQMDKHQRGKIGMEEWVEFVMAHLTEKVRTMRKDSLDFAHLEKTSPETFVAFLGRGLGDRHSEEFKSLYEFLFKTFVESDVEERGAITREQFDILIEDAAKAPRAVGLAPPSAATYQTEGAKLAARQAEFDAMDTDRSGLITFDKFLNWALEHIAGKVQDAQNGKRFTANSAQPAVSSSMFEAVVQYSDPVSWQAAPPLQPAPVHYAGTPTFTSAPVYAMAPVKATSSIIAATAAPAVVAAPTSVRTVNRVVVRKGCC